MQQRKPVFYGDLDKQGKAHYSKHYFWKNFGELDLARTISFSFLAISTLIYVFSIRNLSKPIWKTNILANKFLIGAVIWGFGLQLLAVYNPFLQKIFKIQKVGSSGSGAYNILPDY